MQKPKLKFGEVRDLTTARFAASAMADWIGFCFDPENENFINPLDAKSIIDWVSGPAFVGEFGYQEAAHINQVAELLKLDYVQVPADIGREVLEKIEKSVILYGNNQGRSKDAWFLSDTITEGNCIFICPELSESVLKLIKEKQPAGIELRGTQESSAGIADLEPYNDFLDQLEMG